MIKNPEKLLFPVLLLHLCKVFYADMGVPMGCKEKETIPSEVYNRFGLKKK